jgi:zinc protease
MRHFRTRKEEPMRRIIRAIPLAALLLGAMPVAAGDLGLPVVRTTLDNGLDVVLSPNASSPTVAVDVVYNVGSKVEQKGRSGFAHLFEHMMFQGSENVPKGGHFKIIASHGGDFNGSTGEDYTTYYQEIPAEMLPVVLWLESDRMRSLNVSKENFENQRSVVIEEKLMNYDNQPYVPSFIEINRLAYEGWWPYEHPVIGDMADLKNAKLEWVQAFFHTWYTPRNAVLCIAGNFDEAAARELVQQYFGDIPSPAAPPAFSPPAFEPKKKDTVKIMYDPLAPLPAFHVAWNIPPMRSPEYYPLKLIAMALADGEASRLYQKLVKEKQSVQEMSVDIDGRKEPDLFSVFMILTGQESADDVRDDLMSEIASIAKDGLPDAELSKVKNRIKFRYVANLDNNLSLAVMLGKYELLWGDASLINTEADRFAAVTNEEIKAAAKGYLLGGRRTVLDVVPSQGGNP